MPHLPAARLGDPISDLAAPMVPGPPTGVLGMPGVPPLAGVPTVLIAGKPAAVVGTAGVCTPHYELLVTNVVRPPAPPRVGGQVLIGGFPAARQFDQLVCNARIVAGAPTVLIGG
ncbi:PaaR repeat-containing protein [Actinoplanes sp. NPDC020271]|uniref:PaaR repeat-containing protein n=1 Tax=Actinoplanes sp. NPDC020271 TaxID=3363896 RepID=UPI0037B8B4E4